MGDRCATGRGSSTDPVSLSYLFTVQDREPKLFMSVDPHSPAHFRVLGPLSNDRGFQEAFQCQIGTRYNPDREKCQVW